MNNHLFPVKLLAILGKLDVKQHCGGPSLIGTPKDGKNRLALMTPEMHAAFPGAERFRLAFYKPTEIIRVAESTKLEIYDKPGALVSTHLVVDLRGEQALAVQCELFYMLLKQHDCYINSL